MRHLTTTQLNQTFRMICQLIVAANRGFPEIVELDR